MTLNFDFGREIAKVTEIFNWFELYNFQTSINTYSRTRNLIRYQSVILTVNWYTCKRRTLPQTTQFCFSFRELR